MKIIHIDTAHTWRGGQNQLYLLLKHLQDYDYIRSIVFTPKNSALSGKIRELENTVKVASFSNPLSLVVSLSRYAQQEDTLVHCHSARAHSLAFLSKTLPGWKAPLLVHRRVDFTPSSSFWNKKKYCSKLVDGYIAISCSIQDILISLGIPAEKVHLVYSGVDFSSLDAHSPVDLQHVLGEKPTVPVFVNIGALTDHKGQIYLLQAARLLQEKGAHFKLLICGEGELRTFFEKYIRQNKLEKTVILAGFQPNIPGILKSADFYVMSSHLEGLGTSVIDALYLKKPSIVTRTGGIPEIVQDGRLASCVAPRNADELAKAMFGFLKADKKKLQDMTEHAHQEVKKRFHYHKMGENILNIYNSFSMKEVSR